MGVYAKMEVRGFYPQVGFLPSGEFNPDVFKREPDLGEYVSIVVVYSTRANAIFIHVLKEGIKIPERINGIGFKQYADNVFASRCFCTLKGARRVYRELFKSS